MVKAIFLMLTYNRLQYTKEALEALLKNKYPFHLVIIDNGSTEKGMIDFLKLIKDENDKIIALKLEKENSGLTQPTNWFWKEYKNSYPYLGKIDNDTVIPEDGVERLVDIMDHCPDVAICHGHHWIDDNFPQRRLKHINGRLLLKTRWGGGCFYLIRSSIIHKYGYISTKYGKMGGWTRYQINVRRRGEKVVYAYPLVKVKHLGDPVSGREEERTIYKEYYEYIKNIRREK